MNARRDLDSTGQGRGEGRSPTARRRTVLRGAALLALASLVGCNYSLRGGSFPDHIQTIAVIPFENETTRLELSQELFDLMSRQLPPALGVRAAAEGQADAVVRGVISSYNLAAPNYRPAEGGGRAEVLERQVSITVQVEIVDRVENVILWEDRGLRAEGQFLEQSETEELAKTEALDLLVQRVVDGAQSNW